MNLNRRGFITGLLAIVAMPTLTAIPSVVITSITDYVPTSICELDILCGFKFIQPDWYLNIGEV